MEGWEEYKNKEVFVKLKNGRAYEGKIYEILHKNNVTLIKIIDKLGYKVAFYDSEISVIQEEGQR